MDSMLPTDEPTTQRAIARQGDEGRPYCATHNCLMTANGTDGVVTRYRCPVPGCESTVKRVRKVAVVPSKPLRCQAITCQDPPQYFAVNVTSSQGGTLKMFCPKCGRETIVPRPGFQPDARRRDDDMGDR
jgi:hypothetical protein